MCPVVFDDILSVGEPTGYELERKGGTKSNNSGMGEDSSKAEKCYY